MDSEPSYQYVRGNPVNGVDPSGLFSADLIATSLRDRNVFRSFQGRYGLYNLLRDATENDRVDPLVVDFSGNSSVKYPLRNSIKTTTAKVSCKNYRLWFSQGSSYGLTLDQYLAHLEDAANQEPTNLYWWRKETTELHYYRLIQPMGVTYYDDFGGGSYLPDYIGYYLSGSVSFFGVSRLQLTDRYGNSYVVFSGEGGYGIMPIGLADVEGYKFPHVPGRDRYDVPSELEIQDGITGFGLGYGGIAGVGLGYGQSFSASSDPVILNKAIDFEQYSNGLDISFGIGITYGRKDGPKNETKAWNWVEGYNTGDRSRRTSQTQAPFMNRRDIYSGDDCDCGSP